MELGQPLCLTFIQRMGLLSNGTAPRSAQVHPPAPRATFRFGSDATVRTLTCGIMASALSDQLPALGKAVGSNGECRGSDAAGRLILASRQVVGAGYSSDRVRADDQCIILQ